MSPTSKDTRIRLYVLRCKNCKLPWIATPWALAHPCPFCGHKDVKQKESD